jgi:hypothetical protein
MRDVIRFIEDARDKLSEEYVFDRHYILSLVDSVLEESAMLAFNASVLSPNSGSRIYTQLDDQKHFVQEEFLMPDTVRINRFSFPASYVETDLETQWLYAALNWLTGPLPNEQPALMDFIRCVVDEVMEHDRKDDLVQTAGISIGCSNSKEHNLLRAIDFSESSTLPVESGLSAENINCRPFGLLLLGFTDEARSGEDSREETGTGNWMIFNEEEISLRLYRDNTILHLEARLHGDVSTDFIFLYSQNPFDFTRVCPKDAWVEKTQRGSLAWLYDIPTMQLEKHLIQLGSVFFCQP